MIYLGPAGLYALGLTHYTGGSPDLCVSYTIIPYFRLILTNITITYSKRVGVYQPMKFVRLGKHIIYLKPGPVYIDSESNLEINW